MSEKKIHKTHSSLWCYILRLAVLFVPYGTVLVIHRALYFSVAEGTLVFSAAGMICAAVLLLLIFSVPRASEMLFVLGCTFVLSTLLSIFLEGAPIATGVAFCAKLADKILFLPLYERAREKALVQRTAQNTAKEVREALENYAGRV